jgi:BirA family transcriptional regulator, biotin operon repressor / biotin---[acetyl-CoA-carboxylase] ligase
MAEKPYRSPKELVLTVLSRKDFISGKTLAGTLGMTYPEAGKLIALLKEEGFVIESLQGKGYRLKAAPDILFPDLIRRELNTGYLGQTLYHFFGTDSTNVRARALAVQGAPEGTLVVAEHQDKGKGRLERVWQSPSSQNLLFSFILRPGWPPGRAFYGTALASISLCRVLREITDIQAGIKWPNDIYAGDKKLAGILTEFAIGADRIEYMIIGIGVNCHWAPPEIPAGGQPATSILKETGERISRLHLLTRFLRESEMLYERSKVEGVGVLRKEWNHYSLIQNRRVTILSHQTSRTGIAQGIDEQGGLILRLENGRQETFLSGDLHLRF